MVDAVLLLGFQTNYILAGIVHIEIYIGNSPDYTKNVKCKGIEFPEGFDPDNPTDFENDAPNGFEAWCNLEGRFVSIVRKTFYSWQDSIMICNFGVIA